MSTGGVVTRPCAFVWFTETTTKMFQGFDTVCPVLFFCLLNVLLFVFWLVDSTVYISVYNNMVSCGIRDL